MYDLIIKNGKIVDGSGSLAFNGDIAVKDGKIMKISSKINEATAQVIDATGLIVSPGFIECHTHSDYSSFTGSGCTNFLEQGATTQIAGQCGSSPVPYYEGGMRAQRQNHTPEEFQRRAAIALTAKSFIEYASTQSYGTNMAYFIGHSPIRAKHVGLTDAKATAEQIAEMQQEIKDAMEAGFFGFSTGLVYTPSVYADTEEIAAIASAMKPYGGVYASHIRGEANTVVDSVAEAIEVGKKAGVHVHVSHIKVMGKHNEGKSLELIHMIDKANEQGIPVTADQYPYTASAAGLESQIPPKYCIGGTRAMIERIKNRALRKQIDHDIFHNPEEFTSSIYCAGYDGTLVTSATATKEYENRTIGEIAKTEGKEPIDVMCDLLIANNGITSGIYFNQSPNDLIRLMAHPKVFCGSDSSNVADPRPDEEKVGGRHPRGIGSAVRRLELTRDLHLRTLEDAVHSITYAPAQVFGLKGQGLLKEGYDASITIFDYERLHAQATYEHPYRNNVGVEYVIVNGQIALEHGKITGIRAGKVLKRT